MSQLPYDLECPVDWWIIEICKQIAPFFYNTGHTANMITTEGAIASAYGLYNLYHNRLPQFAIGYALGYAFDCLDGHFARRYKMTSKFGEYYEHGKDILTTIAYFIILWKSFNVPIKFNLLYAFLAFALCVHMAHQQKFLKSSGAFLDILAPLCTNVKNIKYTRLFGCGTFMVASVAIPFYLQRKYSFF